MPVLTLRNLSTETLRRLRDRALRNGVTPEIEAQSIVESSLGIEYEVPELASLPDWIDEACGDRKPKNVVATLLAERRRESR